MTWVVKREGGAATGVVAASQSHGPAVSARRPEAREMLLLGERMLAPHRWGLGALQGRGLVLGWEGV